MHEETVGSKIVKWVLIGVSVLFLVVMLLLPLATVISEALRDGWKTYQAAVTDKYTVKAVLLTLEATAIAVGVNTVFGVFAALAVTKYQFRGKKVLTTLIDVPVTISPIIAGLIFLLTFGRQSVIYPLLHDLGIHVVFAVPGIVLGCAMMALCFFMGKKYNFPKGVAIPKEQRKSVILRGILPMLTLVIILVGTGMGVFTATESSAIAVVYTMFLAYVVFRDAKLRDFGKVIKNALKTLAIVMTLLATAKAFAYMMTELRIPAMITAALLSITSNKYVLMLIINILLLLLGCFMDMAPLITIMTPILVPVVTNPAIGMDPVHFGVVLIFNLAVGLCTPPVGSALFVGCAIGKTPIERTAKNMLPLYATMVIVLLLVTYVPDISLLLPRLLMGYGA